MLVGGRMPRLEDAAVDAAAEMLDEGAEQARIGRADREVAIDEDFDLSMAVSVFGWGDCDRMNASVWSA